MNQVEQKLVALEKMSLEVQEAERVVQMKTGMFFDAFKDLCVKDLGFDKDSLEKGPREGGGIPLHKLALAAFNKGKAQ